MGIVIGIDVGGSTTKIVGLNKGKIQSPMFITAADPVTSLFGAFGKYIYDNGIHLSDVEQVMLTGVGSAFVDSPLYGLPTRKTDEFIANGLGARHATDIDRLIVVSMGTGTSFVRINGDEIQHIGGMGIGGGTLQGLSRLLLKSVTTHFPTCPYPLPLHCSERPTVTPHRKTSPAASFIPCSRLSAVRLCFPP